MEQNKNQPMLEAYEAYADDIYRHCYFRLYNKETARDIMQETFCRVWNYIREGKEIKNMRAFLYRVANNLIIDEIRKKKEGSLDTIMETGVTPEALIGEDDNEKRILGKEVLMLIEELDESHRIIIVMRFIDELSPKEIANILETSENSVSVRLHRGVQKLRELARNKNLSVE